MSFKSIFTSFVNLFFVFVIIIYSPILSQIQAKTSTDSAFLDKYLKVNKYLPHTSKYLVRKGDCDSLWCFSVRLINSSNKLNLTSRNINLIKNLLISLNQIPLGVEGQHFITNGKNLILIKTDVVADIIKLYDEIIPSENFWSIYIKRGREVLLRLDETTKKFVTDLDSIADKKNSLIPTIEQINIPNGKGSFLRNTLQGRFSGGYGFSVQYSLRKDNGFNELNWNVSGYDINQKTILMVHCPNYGAFIEKNEICIWGKVFTFNHKGEVFDPQYNLLVGHLTIPP